MLRGGGGGASKQAASSLSSSSTSSRSRSGFRSSLNASVFTFDDETRDGHRGTVQRIGTFSIFHST